MNSDNNTNTNSQSNDGVRGTDLLGPTLVNPWVGQGGFRTGFQTVDNSCSRIAQPYLCRSNELLPNY